MNSISNYGIVNCLNLSAHLSLSRHIHCPIAYIWTEAWTQIWPSCHRGVQTAWNALLCAKASLRCVGWPRQDERGAPLSSAALCNTEQNLTRRSRPKSLPSKTHFKCCHCLLASTSFPMARRGERTKKVSQHPVSDFKLENRTWVPRYTWWINTEKREAAMNEWYTSSTLVVMAAF